MDLENGVLEIKKSKNDKDRLVPLSNPRWQSAGHTARLVVGVDKAAQREFYEMYGEHETQIRELRRKVTASK